MARLEKNDSNVQKQCRVLTAMAILRVLSDFQLGNGPKRKEESNKK